MKIVAVAPDSPLAGRVAAGCEIISVDGSEIIDAIDFRFKTSEENLKIIFSNPEGEKFEIRLKNNDALDLGLDFEDDKVKTCNNNCIFCFVRQQPKGMRKALYVKDEDYRLSFTHGNFITLSNITSKEYDRIIEQRLSPLYVSVHTTDDDLRKLIFCNKKLPPVLPRLKQLTENGIQIHAQVVLCPGINDGENLKKTIDDLYELSPGVVSLAVVPVGLTKYRDGLPKLRHYDKDEARSIVKYVHSRQQEFLKKTGSRFVWPADEFYIIGGLPFPRYNEYEEMPQFENGVGMVREFITMFRRRRRYLKNVKSGRRILFLTGYSAFQIIENEIVPFMKERVKLTVHPVINRFWGDKVTVSGLLTGQDLLREARNKTTEFDALVIPPNCLNSDNLFLDNMSLTHFIKSLGKPVYVGRYNLADTIREVFV